MLTGFFSCDNKDTESNPQAQETILDLRPFRSEWDLDQWKKFRMLCDYKNTDATLLSNSNIQLSEYCDCIASVMIDEGYQADALDKAVIELKTQVSSCLLRNIKR